MKKTSTWLIALGVIMMIAGCLIFTNLNHLNAVDSHNWTINVNGIRSFPWLTFGGFVIFIIGVLAEIGTRKQRNMYE